MAINLETEARTGGQSAYVKLDKEGDQWVGMLIDYDREAPLFEYQDPSTRATKDDGTPRTQDLLTVLLMAKTSCRVSMPPKEGEDEREDVDGADAVGTVARIYIQGHNRWTPERADSFWEAKKKHGNLAVGDVVCGRLNEITNIGRGGRRLSQAKKVIGFQVRKARDGEESLVARCEDEHRRLKAISLEPATAGGRAPDFDEEPF